jgi:hypothetical protein
MDFIKEGLIISPVDERIPLWGKKRLMLPTPIILNNNILRLFLGFCDQKNIGRVGFVDLDSKNLKNIIFVSQKPSLDIGEKGDFDEHGVVPTCILKEGTALYLYYGGFSRIDNKYTMFEGLAVSYDDGLSFNRVNKNPILKSTSKEKYFRVASFVLKEVNSYKMWYIGGNSWREIEDKLLPEYKCQYIQSNIKEIWSEEYINCLDFEDESEHGFSRPWVYKKNNFYCMFFGIRKNGKYYPGYAESNDGIKWVRREDKIKIELSKNGWDSEMITYPAIVDVDTYSYYLYSGNNNGESGIGYAILINKL